MLSRVVVPGMPHHVTQRGVRSMDVFDVEADLVRRTGGWPKGKKRKRGRN